MGNFLSTSKVGEDDKETDSSKSAETTPVLSQKFIKDLQYMDPRSPTANITRTPIQGLTTNEASSFTCEFVGTPTTTKVIGIDPRSPNSEFVRTPIVINCNPEQVSSNPMKLHNKNLDNVRKSIIQFASPAPKGDETKQNHTPPKLLESSPISKKIQQQKRKSFVGVLETNLDYIETDLDTVVNSFRTPKKCDEIDAQSSKNLISVECLANVDPRSPTTDFLRTPVQITKKIGEIVLNDTKTEENPLSDEEESSTEDNVQKEPETIENLEEIVVTPIKPKVIDIAENPYKTEKKTMGKNLKEFDRKLSNLIYEDNGVSNTLPRSKRNKDGSRTPLGVRNGNGVRTLPRLKVSDKPTKQGPSKIPVFKEKLIKGRFEPCENTPPRSSALTNETMKRTNWDPNTTLVI